MKRTALFALAGVALLGAAACSKTGVQEAPKVYRPVSASVEDFNSGSTKGEFDFSTPGKAQFKWSAGDQIAVASNDKNNYKLLFTLQGAGGTSEGSFGSADELKDYKQFPEKYFYAAYPADHVKFALDYWSDSYHIGATGFVFESNYAASHVGKMEPMCVAYVKNDSGVPSKIEFRHVAAMVKLSIKGLPSNAISVHFRTPDKIVVGTPSLQSFQLADGVIKDIPEGSSASNMYVVSNLLSPSVIKPVTDFYIPVPAGEFPGGYKVSVNMPSTSNAFSYEVTSSKTLEVGQMACINLKVETDKSAPAGYKLVADK